jgi:diadenylate cyclase
LARIPRLPDSVVAAIVARFGTLQKIMGSEVAELENVDGLDAGVARTVKDGLARLAESSILDRYS